LITVVDPLRSPTVTQVIIDLLLNDAPGIDETSVWQCFDTRVCPDCDGWLTLAALHCRAFAAGRDPHRAVPAGLSSVPRRPARTGRASLRLLHVGHVAQSMARVGSCLDNACVEVSSSTIKVEYVYRQHFPTNTDASEKISDWINGFYITRRRHSAADGMSPVDIEEFIAEARRASTT